MTLRAADREVWIDLAEAVGDLRRVRNWPDKDGYHWYAEKVAVGEIEARELADRGDGWQGTMHLPKDWLQRHWENAPGRRADPDRAPATTRQSRCRQASAAGSRADRTGARTE
jgi:hypothetical protein